MKIFYISQLTFPSPIAQSIYDMCVSETFSNLGYDTTLIVKNKFWARPPKNYDGNVWGFYGVEENFRIVKVFSLPRDVNLFFRNALKKVDKINSLIFTQGVHTAKFFIERGHKVLLDRHGLMPGGQMEQVRAFVNSPNFLGMSVITKTIFEDHMEKIPELRNKIAVHPNGLRSEEYFAAAQAADRQKEQNPRSEFVAGYLGSFFPGKGVEVILKLAEICPDVKFHVYGGRKGQNTLESVKKTYNVAELPSNFILKGLVPHCEVPNVIASFDVALLPNQPKVLIKTDDIGNWTSPMKMFEYMGTGRAIIASDIPVLREVLKDGYNSILVPPSNIKEWAKAVNNLRQDEKMRKEIAANAQKDIRGKYTWENRIRHIFKELNIESKVRT